MTDFDPVMEEDADGVKAFEFYAARIAYAARRDQLRQMRGSNSTEGEIWMELGNLDRRLQTLARWQMIAWATFGVCVFVSLVLDIARAVAHG